MTGDTTCGWTSNVYEFAYAGQISQTVTIPSGMTGTSFSLSYLLDFDDPNNDGAWNQFSASVYDQTTGTYLGSGDFFSGLSGDLACSNRGWSWTGSLAGHTLQVLFSGSKAYPNTHIRIRNIVLYQH